MRDMRDLEQPLNANERYLHAIAIRLDAIVHMLSCLTEVYAEQNSIPITENKVIDSIDSIETSESIDLTDSVEVKKRRKRK